eukprot:2907923-Prymnesium_polylepis.1
MGTTSAGHCLQAAVLDGPNMQAPVEGTAREHRKTSTPRRREPGGPRPWPGATRRAGGDGGEALAVAWTTGGVGSSRGGGRGRARDAPVLVQHVQALPRDRIPYPDRRVERRAGQHEVRARVGAALPCRTPIDRVDLLGVLSQVVHRPVGRHAPQLGGVVVGARHQVGRVELAHVDHAVRRAARKARLVAPVHVEDRLLVEGKLLLDAARRRVPDDDRLVDRAAQQVLPRRVPLEREDGPIVLGQRLIELTRHRPDARLPVVRACRERGAVVIPLQRRHVLALLLVLGEVLQHERLRHSRRLALAARAVGHLPDARGRVARARREQERRWIPRAIEDLRRVPRERRHLVLGRVRRRRRVLPVGLRRLGGARAAAAAPSTAAVFIRVLLKRAQQHLQALFGLLCRRFSIRLRSEGCHEGAHPILTSAVLALARASFFHLSSSAPSISSLL